MTLTCRMVALAMAMTALVISVSASCYGGALTSVGDEEVCEVDDNHTLRVGEWVLLVDTCHNCTCLSSHYTCCGVGAAAGVAHPGEGEEQPEYAGCVPSE